MVLPQHSEAEIPQWSYYGSSSNKPAEEQEQEEDYYYYYGSQQQHCFSEGAPAGAAWDQQPSPLVVTRSSSSSSSEDDDEEEKSVVGRDDEGHYDNEEKKNPPSRSSSSGLDAARRVGVAVSGAALTGLGLVMIPLPTPFGCVVAASGMAVLGTEFPAAQRVLDLTVDAAVEALEGNCNNDDDEKQEQKQQLQENGDDDPLTSKQEQCADGAVAADAGGGGKVRSATNAATAKLKQSAQTLGQKALLPVLRKLGGSKAVVAKDNNDGDDEKAA